MVQFVQVVVAEKTGRPRVTDADRRRIRQQVARDAFWSKADPQKVKTRKRSPADRDGRNLRTASEKTSSPSSSSSPDSTTQTLLFPHHLQLLPGPSRPSGRDISFDEVTWWYWLPVPLKNCNQDESPDFIGQAIWRQAKRGHGLARDCSILHAYIRKTELNRTAPHPVIYSTKLAMIRTIQAELDDHGADVDPAIILYATMLAYHEMRLGERKSSLVHFHGLQAVLQRRKDKRQGLAGYPLSSSTPRQDDNNSSSSSLFQLSYVTIRLAQMLRTEMLLDLTFLFTPPLLSAQLPPQHWPTHLAPTSTEETHLLHFAIQNISSAPQRTHLVDSKHLIQLFEALHHVHLCPHPDTSDIKHAKFISFIDYQLTHLLTRLRPARRISQTEEDAMMELFLLAAESLTWIVVLPQTSVPWVSRVAEIFSGRYREGMDSFLDSWIEGSMGKLDGLLWALVCVGEALWALALLQKGVVDQEVLRLVGDGARAVVGRMGVRDVEGLEEELDAWPCMNGREARREKLGRLAGRMGLFV